MHRVHLLVLLVVPAWTQETPLEEWSEQRAKHLLSRSAWGCTAWNAAQAAKADPVSVVRGILTPVKELDPRNADVLIPDLDAQHYLPAKLRKTFREACLVRNLRQRVAFGSLWIERILDHPHSALERMTLFWSGHFACQHTDSFVMGRQYERLRRHALGNFRDLLHETIRDPAILFFLDNTKNHVAHPNENLARELLELYSLGEGNYTEGDVKEAARALTGYGIDDRNQFQFSPEHHDFGIKTIFGVTGNFDGDDLIELILQDPQCARYIAEKLLTYFEGQPPSPSRVESYASQLRDDDYELAPLLNRLFLDPDFYREEVMGSRFQSPLDYLMGTCTRLSIEPPGYILAYLARLQGQELLSPPGVDGWEEGPSWLSPSTYVARSNAIALLLGLSGTEAINKGSANTQYYYRFPLRRLERRGWRADLPIEPYLAWPPASDPGLLVEIMAADLLPRPADPSTISSIAALLQAETPSLGDEQALVRAMHRLLTSPEAHLH